ncbi:hypothetical protein M2T23_26330, partial [Escherichia coli]|nr:hypothetical protein [Escherichia coli]
TIADRFYALGLIAKPVPVREAVWYGEPAPDVIRPLMAVSWRNLRVIFLIVQAQIASI